MQKRCKLAGAWKLILKHCRMQMHSKHGLWEKGEKAQLDNIKLVLSFIISLKAASVLSIVV